jgi:tetratricopeptide (TPR) repeat protein
MSSLPPSATDPNDLDGMSLITLHPVVEQAEQAIQSGQFEAACTLIETALMAGEEPDAQAKLLECLGQARAGLQDYAEAAQAFQRAYDAVTEQHDKARLFQCACQAYRQERDFPALLRLADLQLEHVTSKREQADCLLVAGEALVRLRRYREARECYLTPAANLDDAAPSARVYLWNYLGVCALVEHHFPEAAEAFHKSNTFGLALQY